MHQIFFASKGLFIWKPGSLAYRDSPVSEIACGGIFEVSSR